MLRYMLAVCQPQPQCVHTEKVCVVGFLHQVLAGISFVKTALGPLFRFKLSKFSLRLLRPHDLVMLNLCICLDSLNCKQMIKENSKPI